MKSPYTFYNRYIKGLKAEDALNAEYPLTGKSPFDGGPVHITEDGQFRCAGTGKSGNPKEFLQELYRFLSESGIEQAIEVESRDQPELRENICQSQIVRFREDVAGGEEVLRRCGAGPSMLERFPLWMNQAGRQWHYIYYSPASRPVCRYSWEDVNRTVQITGVPRPQVLSNGESIVFVENPLHKEYLEHLLGIPMLVRPTPEMLEWIDYQTLIGDKTVVLLKSNEHGPWESSYHPFLKHLQKINKPVKTIDIMLLTRGRPLTLWLSEDEDAHAQKLKQAIEQTQLRKGTAFDRTTYEAFINGEGRDTLYFPQDLKAGLFWYGMADGSLAHSCPLNILTLEEAKKLYNLNCNITRDPGIRLSGKDMFNIASSVGQHSLAGTFCTLKDLLTKHIYFTHESLPALIALWIMGGYVYQLFNAYPYLHVRGRRDTGKTTILEIIAACGFNGLLESQATRASVIQQVDKLGCTLCLDEFESHSKGTGDQYVHMINVGYKKSGTYRKMRGSSSKTYNVYSPKVLASIDTIQASALRSRTIPVRTIEKPSRINLEPWDSGGADNSNQVNLIRRGCYGMGMNHHEAIRRCHRRLPYSIKLPSGIKLQTRRHELVSPLLAIARQVDINRDLNVEEDLLEAIQFCWHPGLEQQQRREQLLAEELVKWSDSSSFKEKREYRAYKGKIAINNECWEGTRLAEELGGKDQVLTWLLNQWNLKKEAVHMSAYGTNKSCTLFPLDLKIAGKQFRELFSR